MKQKKLPPRTRSYIISTVVSRVFDPFLILALTTGLMIWESSLSMVSKYIFMGIVLCVMILPPIVLLLWAIAHKHISDWDISNRSERPIGFIVVFLLGFLNIIIVNAFGDSTLTNLFIMYQLWMAGFMCITFLWKISGHTGTLALATGLLVLKAGIEWWPVLLCVPVLAIARVVRKNHTPAQAILGGLYSWGILYVAHTLGLV
jgi:hypothetical protein